MEIEMVAKLVAQRAQKCSERGDFLAHCRSHPHADEHHVGAVVPEEFARPAFTNTQRSGSQNTNVTRGNLIKFRWLSEKICTGAAHGLGCPILHRRFD